MRRIQGHSAQTSKKPTTCPVSDDRGIIAPARFLLAGNSGESTVDLQLRQAASEAALENPGNSNHAPHSEILPEAGHNGYFRSTSISRVKRSSNSSSAVLFQRKSHAGLKPPSPLTMAGG